MVVGLKSWRSGLVRSSSCRKKSRVQQLVEVGRRIWAIGTIELI